MLSKHAEGFQKIQRVCRCNENISNHNFGLKDLSNYELL